MGSKENTGEVERWVVSMERWNLGSRASYIPDRGSLEEAGNKLKVRAPVGKIVFSDVKWKLFVYRLRSGTCPLEPADAGGSDPKYVRSGQLVFAPFICIHPG